MLAAILSPYASILLVAGVGAFIVPQVRAVREPPLLKFCPFCEIIKLEPAVM